MGLEWYTDTEVAHQSWSIVASKLSDEALGHRLWSIVQLGNFLSHEKANERNAMMIEAASRLGGHS